MNEQQHGHVDVRTQVLEEEIIVRNEGASAEVAEYALWLGDDSLILAQQLGMWISRAPELEEDVALANIALDLIGHARSFLHFAGSASGRTEDDLAYWRDEQEFRSAHLFEQPNGDFAHTIARQLVASCYLFELYARLRASQDDTLSAIAEKALKEADYHRDHATQWLLRLSLGTEDSRSRMITALADLWPYADELFVDEPVIDRLEGIAVRPSSLRGAFEEAVSFRLVEAELEIPRGPIASGGGRRGKHSEYLGYLLARDAGLGPPASGSELVNATHVVSAPQEMKLDESSRRAWQIAASVVDPEIPVLTIEDLGVLRAVTETESGVEVIITPTYSGCPAMDAIKADLEHAFVAAGYPQVHVRLVLSPAWTTDWMTEAGKQKLREYGIAAPTGKARAQPNGPVSLQLAVKCPRCASLNTRELSRFGSTSCKALYQCRECLEPFDYFKVL